LARHLGGLAANLWSYPDQEWRGGRERL